MASDNILQGKIRKQILKEGSYSVPTDDETKVLFYYKVSLPDGTVIDNNRDHGSPLELIFGKQFKLDVWEECLKTMKVKEISRFSVSKDLLAAYPVVAKSLRDIAKGKNPNQQCDHEDHGERHHCCGMQSMLEKGLGYSDLDELMKKPQDLDFELEIFQCFEAGSYEKDPWAMDMQEKFTNVPKLHEEGNHLYKKQKYVEAADRYAKALGLLEELLGREQPNSEEWKKLDKMMIPLLLNYSQCQLILEHYNEAIQHTTTVIEKDPKNVKAFYRRGKAHVMAWNPQDARNDFAVALDLDPELKAVIEKDLHSLDKMQKIRDNEDREKMRKLFG